MWINLALYGFLAIGLFPDSVFSQEQDLCETCTGDDCTVKIHNVDRRFYKYNGDLYYFETDKEKYSWLEGHARCTTMFLGYSVQPTNLVSFHTKQEFDFIKGKLMSLSIRRAFFGGRRSNDNIYDWVWTDGSTMNKNLIPSLRPQEARNEESLWNGPQPDNWYERENVMEIKNYGFHQLNDVPETYKDGSFVCKISCTKSTCNQPRLSMEDAKNRFILAVEEKDDDLVQNYLNIYPELLLAKFDGVDIYIGYPVLMWAVSKSYPHLITILLEKGAYIEATDTVSEDARLGETALHRAAFINNKEIVGLLIKGGANVNAQSYEKRTALHKAAVDASSDVVELLLKAGAKINAQEENGHAALHYAACRNWSVVKTLLDYGANIDLQSNRGTTALHHAALCSSFDIMELLLKAGAKIDVQDDQDDTALLLTVTKNNKEIVDKLIKGGANVNAQNYKSKTALHYAALAASFDVVELLLKAGAKINAQDDEGKTALHYAALAASFDVVELLLKAGEKIDAQDEQGRTALHLAAIAVDASFDVVELLLKAGVKIDAQDDYGYTALHYAAFHNCSVIVKTLLDYGANKKLQSNRGETALDIAADRSFPEIVGLLS